MKYKIIDKETGKEMPKNFNLNEGKANHRPLHVVGVSLDGCNFICGMVAEWMAFNEEILSFEHINTSKYSIIITNEDADG